MDRGRSIHPDHTNLESAIGDHMGSVCPGNSTRVRPLGRHRLRKSSENPAKISQDTLKHIKHIPLKPERQTWDK